MLKEQSGCDRSIKELMVICEDSRSFPLGELRNKKTQIGFEMIFNAAS